MIERNANILTLKCSFVGKNPVGLTLLLSATIFGRLCDMTLLDGHVPWWFALLIPQLGILMIIYQLTAPSISYSLHNEGIDCYPVLASSRHCARLGGPQIHLTKKVRSTCMEKCPIFNNVAGGFKN